MGSLYLLSLALAALLLLIASLTSFFAVHVAQVAVITRFGKVLRIAGPGLHWKLPFDKVQALISLRAQQISLTVGSKTKDNVLIAIPISIEVRVRPEMVYESWSKLPEPAARIAPCVERVLLGIVPGLMFDELSPSQSGIASNVRGELESELAPFGYQIVNVLVTGFNPNNMGPTYRYRGMLFDSTCEPGPLRHRSGQPGRRGQIA